MYSPSMIAWLLFVVGVFTFLPLLAVQLMVIFKPNDRKTKDLVIGSGEEWRDHTHFKSALAFAWADWLIIFPLLVAGSYGVISGSVWGYVLWFALGIISVYFSILCWVLEKEYVFPSRGSLAYYTYYWGLFLYWGIAAIIYSFMMVINYILP